MTDATLTWTEERVERLTQLWQEGRSASHIAAELGGVSRNAVIGKVHRLGLSGRGKPQPQAPAASKARPRGGDQRGEGPRGEAQHGAPAASAPAEAAPKPQPMVAGANALSVAPETIAEAAHAPAPARRPAADVVVPISDRVTIMDLRENMCRWPIGDPSWAEFRFCGARALTGMPYCDCHAQIAYQPSSERRRERKTGTG